MRVEAVAGVVDRDARGEVRVPAVVARVPGVALHCGRVTSRGPGMQQRATGTEERQSSGDQSTSS
jgi:hypothetical protein